VNAASAPTPVGEVNVGPHCSRCRFEGRKRFAAGFCFDHALADPPREQEPSSGAVMSGASSASDTLALLHKLFINNLILPRFSARLRVRRLGCAQAASTSSRRGNRDK
jgi:hypothetical protein